MASFVQNGTQTFELSMLPKQKTIKDPPKGRFIEVSYYQKKARLYLGLFTVK